MTPEQKCVSLETAKLLKEAGFPQEAEHYYVFDDEVRPSGTLWSLDHWNTVEGEWGLCREFDKVDSLAAPDAQEIRGLLPETLGHPSKGKQIDIEEFAYWYGEKRKYQVQISDYVGSNPPLPHQIFTYTHENEAEARAACWLWLKKENLL